MKIDKITITGADNNTDINKLVELQNRFPIVEWAILFTKDLICKPRFPNQSWMDELCKHDVNLSAHFCGWYSKEVLEHDNFKLITDLPKQFKRVQLNYNFKRNKFWDITHLIRFLKTNKDRSIILQYNNSNAEAIAGYLEAVNDFSQDIPDNLHFLYDASGGAGKVIELIDNPFETYTGYAGGISDLNVLSICEKIENFNNPSTVFIDMESGIRTNNEFDLDKVTSVLTQFENKINKGKFVSNTNKSVTPLPVFTIPKITTRFDD